MFNCPSAHGLVEPLAIVKAGMDKLLKLLLLRAAVAMSRGGSTATVTVGRRFCYNLDLDSLY